MKKKMKEQLKSRGDRLLIYLSLKYEGDWDRVLKAIHYREPVDLKDLEKTLDKFEQDFPDVSCCTVMEEEYPEIIKQGYKMPFTIFYKGDLSLINQKPIAIIGSETDGTVHSRKEAVRFTEALCKNHPIATFDDNADSIGSYVYNTAGKKAIIVSNKAMNTSHLSDQIGLIVSTYPYATAPEYEKKEDNARQLANIGDCLIVLESKIRSREILTAGMFDHDHAKTIFCLPYDENTACGEGNAILFSRGALCVENPEDVEDFLKNPATSYHSVMN